MWFQIRLAECRKFFSGKSFPDREICDPLSGQSIMSSGWKKPNNCVESYFSICGLLIVMIFTFAAILVMSLFQANPGKKNIKCSKSLIKEMKLR